MNIFVNNYRKLVKENEYEIIEMNDNLQNEINDIINYCRGNRVSFFELEVIKKDMIAFAQEAELEHITLEEKLGMPPKDFCDNMIADNPSSFGVDYLITFMRISSFFFMLMYLIDFWLRGLPSKHGIILSHFFWVLIMGFVSCIIDPISLKYTFGKKRAVQKLRFFLVFLIWFFYFSVIQDSFNTHFLITGNGWVILAVLVCLSLFAWLGGNYYWNKQSEKYNWQ